MRFTSTALAAVIGAVAFAAPAAAEYDIAYLGLRGSYVMTDSGSTKGSQFFDFDEDYEDGYGVGVFMGWVLNDNFRLEVEGTYRGADIDTVTMVRDDFFIPPDYLVGDNLAGQQIDVGGDAQSAKDNTWVFGYQFMAGITFPIDEGISMSASYRFFQTDDFVYVDILGEEFETNLTQHSVDIALQFHL
jgi:opacity protein-like surface antigen